MKTLPINDTNDINHNFGEDMNLGPGPGQSFDLLNVVGLTKSQQRVLKRLMTNPGDYIWHPEYGAGLPREVGRALNNINFDIIKSRIMANIYMEASVAKTPPARIFLQSIQGGLFVQINYVENPSQAPVVLQFNVSG